MRKEVLSALLFLIFSMHSSAQLLSEERIQDSIIGWWSALPKKAVAPVTNNGYSFSVAQQEQTNALIRWMYKTYTPVGGLGTYKKIFDADLGAQKRFAPHIYGVMFRVWDVSFDKKWMTADSKFKPIDEQYTSFYIRANYIPENNPVIFVNNSNRYVFTMPVDGGGSEQLKESRKGADGRIHPNVYPYLTMQSEFQNIFLVPGNKLPIKTVTKGELLDMAESSIETLLNTEMERVQQQFTNANAQQDAFAYRKKAIEAYRAKIQKLRTKHQQTLDLPAVVNNPELSIYQFETDPDPFDISENRKQWKQYFTVHQYTKELLEKCRTDKPQWIVVTFPFVTSDRNNQLKEMYKAVTENFNYEYVYNYFFTPEKIKGLDYKPANEESLKKRLKVYKGR